MIAAGCDVGSNTAKAVILGNGGGNGGRILAAETMRVRSTPEMSAEEIMALATSKAGLSLEDLDYCVGTGYGRRRIPFVDEVVSEIACHGRGAHHFVPSARTVIDIGGQDCKIVRIDEKGVVVDFATNDKCAAGTGRFIEVMAKLLELGLDEIGPISLKSRDPLPLTTICTVWMQSEVIYHLNQKRPIEDLAAGINQVMAERIAAMVKRIGVERDVCMTGGVAKNVAIVKNLDRILGVRIKKFGVDPQIMGAVGAALFAQEKLEGRSQE